MILAVEDVSLAFGGVKALSEVSFDVREHEIRAIIGPNGAGKSSMLNVINGVYHPQQGRITFRGEMRTTWIRTTRPRSGIARTFQSLALFKGMSVLDNIMTGRNLKMRSEHPAAGAAHRPGAARGDASTAKCVEQIIDFLEIQPYRKTPVGRLPYGLQKRVDLARALAMEPKILLLDEPMAGMNVEEKQDMCRFILDVNDEFGTTIVLIEHDMGVVMDISDRVVVLDYGKKIGDGTPDEVRANQAVIDAYLGRERTEAAMVHDAHEELTGRVLRAARDGRRSASLLLRRHDSARLLRRSAARRPDVRRAVFAGGAGLRADLQGLGRVQFRPGRDGAVRGARRSRASVEKMPLAGGVRARRSAIMVVLAWLIERLVLRPLVNQDAVVLLMATLGVTYFLDGFGQTSGAATSTRSTLGMPKEAGDDPAEGDLRGRHPGQHGGPGRRGASPRVLVRGAGAVLPEDRRPAARCARSPTTTRPRSRSAFRLNRIWVIVWTVAGFVALVAGMIWGSKLGVQFSLSLVALKALPVVILGGFTSIPGRDHRRTDHRRGREDRRGLPRPDHGQAFDLAGGGIENWFAYVLALLFLLVRPEGLFGEKHIDRV